MNRWVDTQQLKHTVTCLLAADYTIVSCDEACFTWRGYQQKAWALPHSNLELGQQPTVDGVNCVACVGAIDDAVGKLHFGFRPRSFDGDAFVQFFDQLAAKLSGRKWALLLDNCSIHKSTTLKLRAQKAGVPLVYSVSY